uniref:ZP domain-containing protein n=3 Tax=Ciona intestinalis TaxID=7719 RepID=H2Y3B6_CIOIN
MMAKRVRSVNKELCFIHRSLNTTSSFCSDDLNKFIQFTNNLTSLHTSNLSTMSGFIQSMTSKSDRTFVIIASSSIFNKSSSLLNLRKELSGSGSLFVLGLCSTNQPSTQYSTNIQLNTSLSVDQESKLKRKFDDFLCGHVEIVNDMLSPCDSSPCSNNGTCQVNGSSHHCICMEDYFGKSCQYLMPDIKCGSSEIVVDIDAKFVKDKSSMAFNNSSIFFDGFQDLDHCNSKSTILNMHGDAVYKLKVNLPFVQCGLYVEVHDSIITVSGSIYQGPVSSNPLVSFASFIGNITCYYQNKYHVGMGPTNITKSYKVTDRDSNYFDLHGSGQFLIGLTFYGDVNFANKLPNDPLMVVGYPIYVLIYAVVPSDTKLYVQSCVASPDTVYDPNSPRIVPLITNNCLSNSGIPTTLFTVERSRLKFSFIVFRWKDRSSDRVNIFCSAQVCQLTDSSCMKKCQGSRNRRAFDEKS